MKINLKGWKRRFLLYSLACLFLLCGLVQFAFCADDTSTMITEYLPIILQLAIFGMLIGMFKKFGSNR